MTTSPVRWIIPKIGGFSFARVPPASLALEPSPSAESLLLPDCLGMPLMPGDDVDLVAFHLPGEDDRRLVLDDAPPQARGHPLGVIGIEIQLAGNLLVGEVQAEEIAAQDPGAQWSMMAGEDGPGQVVELAGAEPAKIPPPSRWGLVVALVSDPVGVAKRAADPLRPPQVAHDLEAAGVVDQDLNVEHPGGEGIATGSMSRRRMEMQRLFNCTDSSRQVQVTP